MMPPCIEKLDPLRLEQLMEFAESLSQQNNFHEILRLVSRRAAQLLNAETALIMMLNPRTQKTVKTIIKNGEEASHPGYKSIQLLITGWIMKHKEPLLTPDIQNDTRFSMGRRNDVHVGSALGIPLRVEGTFIGALVLLNKHGNNEFNAFDLMFLNKLAVIAGPYLRNVQKIQEYFEAPLPEAALLAKYEALGLLGKSRKFIELLQAVEAAASCDVRVLLQGASGTGKELIAKAIHQFSARGKRPFVAIDCGAIPTHLLESELFGHIKGAFTGADTNRKGLLQEADQGTLFMDEVTNLPLEMQAKLMRVLQEGEVRPLGSNKASKVDVRIITASSGSLQDLIRENKFREDLYYRIYVYPIHIPSLNERSEDIPVLADHFLRRFAKQQNKQAERFHPDNMEFMKDRDWSGNIRELENFVERLITLAPKNVKVLGRAVLPEDLKEEMRRVKFVYDEDKIPKSLAVKLAEYEEDLIRQALTAHDWNQSRAARSLKIAVQTIRYKMDKLGIRKGPTSTD
jgi:transcriptional regulator with GAF, ATPase, and Fis domain